MRVVAEARARAGRSAARPLGVALALLLALGRVSGAAQIAVPRPQGYVTDLAGVIDARTKAQLVALDRELQQKTGAEIAIVTVRTTKPDDPFDYAMAIAEQWKPGAKGKDNGVVFLVAVDDRKVQILTGYGVEGPLPDGKVGEIRDTLIKPAFRAGDFSRGILDATKTLAALIAADSGVELTGAPAPVRRPAHGGGGIGVIFLVLIILAVAAFLNTLGRGGRGGRRRFGGFGGPIVFGGGRGGFGGGGGGFGGFGGGSFGGGGAGGDW